MSEKLNVTDEKNVEIAGSTSYGHGKITCTGKILMVKGRKENLNQFLVSALQLKGLTTIDCNLIQSQVSKQFPYIQNKEDKNARVYLYIVKQLETSKGKVVALYNTHRLPKIVRVLINKTFEVVTVGVKNGDKSENKLFMCGYNKVVDVKNILDGFELEI